MARARQNSCRCPTLRLPPPSVMIASRPPAMSVTACMSVRVPRRLIWPHLMQLCDVEGVPNCSVIMCIPGIKVAADTPTALSEMRVYIKLYCIHNHGLIFTKLFGRALHRHRCKLQSEITAIQPEEHGVLGYDADALPQPGQRETINRDAIDYNGALCWRQTE